MANQNLMNHNATPQEQYGFVFYRTDYTDDAQWNRFVALLKYQALHSLTQEGNPELYDAMDWKVMVNRDL
jgi:hypothetical protein